MGKKFSLKPLVSKIERTEIESKSQPARQMWLQMQSWYQRYKELKLKANHNTFLVWAALLFYGCTATEKVYL